MAKRRLACNLITVERLRELLDYDPATGIFRWRSSRGRGVRAGDIAGTPQNHGYWQLCIDAKIYMAHRIAWFYVHGEWPEIEIDHWDLDKRNNRLDNLRNSTKSQNQANMGPKRKNNITGMKGVSFDTGRKRWIVGITHENKKIFIGRFDSKTEATAAYAKAAHELFGEFARIK